MLQVGVCDFIIYIDMDFRRVMMLMTWLIINGENFVVTEDLYKLFSSLNMGVIGVNMGRIISSPVRPSSSNGSNKHLLQHS